MYRFNLIELHKPILGELDYGMVLLGSVPVIDGALQVGVFAGEEQPMAALSAAINPSLIILSRADGQLLQVDDHDKADGSGRRPDPVRIFESPISRLVLQNTIATEDTWRIEDEAVEITDMKRFDKFLTQMFLFAYRKQHPGIGAAELLSLLDAYREFKDRDA